MTTPMLPTRLALALAAAFLPLAAQTPLFNDGTAFGGSKVFSEGLSPLANPARFDRSPAGWYLSVVDGDQRAKDNSDLLRDTASEDAAITSAALIKLKDSPWALRTRAYGLTGVKEGTNFGFTREEVHSLLAAPDLQTLHLGTPGQLADNATAVDGRRAVVNRLHFGGGTLAAGTAAGFSLRMEQWEVGTLTAFMNRNGGLQGGAWPFLAVEPLVMAFSATTRKTFNWAVDAGFTTELAQGLRLGAMVDQLNKKRLWDVELKPQIRAALQLDLGPNTQVTAESDINAVQRMPFPVKQQSASGSLRYQVSPSVVFTVGAERRKIGDASTTRVGGTLQFRTSAMLLSLGFQAGQDKPLKGLGLMVN